MTLTFPILLEIIFSFLIPSQTNLINETKQNLEFKTARKLDIKDYNRNQFIYFLNGTYSTDKVKILLDIIYTKQNKPNVNLFQSDFSNISDYVLDKRKNDIKNLVNDYYFGMQLNVISDSKFSANLYYSTMAFHSSSVILNELTNLYLKFLTNDLTKTITTYNSPITLNEATFVSNGFLDNLACIDVLPTSLLNLINAEIAAFIISLISIHITNERENGFKTLQFISSVQFYVYWLSNYFFDILICFFSISTNIIALKIVDSIKNDPSNEVHAIISNDSASYFFFLFFVSSLSWPLVAYIFSFFFKSDIICFVILFIIQSVAAFIDMLSSFIQLFINLETPGNNSYFSRLIFIFFN